MIPNGFNQDMQEPAGPQAIHVVWDPEKHGVTVQFDTRQFHTLEFVKALLGMGLSQIETAIRQQQALKMSQQMAQQQAEANVIGKILKH